MLCLEVRGFTASKPSGQITTSRGNLFFARLRPDPLRRIGTRGRTRGRGESVLRHVEGFIARYMTRLILRSKMLEQEFTPLEPGSCQSFVAQELGPNQSLASTLK